MSKSLINCYQDSPNTIKHIYLEDGFSKTEIVKFKPFLGYPASSTEKANWTDIFGNPVKVKVFDSITDMKSWKKENSDVLDILGDVSPHIQFIATQYRNDIEFTTDGLICWVIDIETIFSRTVEGVSDSNGFPSPLVAPAPIVTITIQDMFKNEYIILGFKDNYTPEKSNVKFIRCNDEAHLLKTYIELFNEAKPHILTGWNTSTTSMQSFDVPYIVNRVKKVLGDEWVKKLSIDRVVQQHETTTSNGQKVVSYSLQGTILWDYMDLYKKYIGEPRESHSLNFIGMYELGEGKVSYAEEHSTLENLYYNDFQKFCHYNLRDCEVIFDLNNKLRFIEVAMAMMQQAKCSPESIFGTVQPWDCILYNELLKVKKLCPSVKRHDKQEYVGGFVKDIVPGLYNWIAVYDIVSSYPNNLISANISPETVVNYKDLPDELKAIKSEYGTIEKCIDINSLSEIQPILEKYNVSFTSNGQFFRNDIDGFLPTIIHKIFKQRMQFKKDAKEAKKNNNPELAKQLDLLVYIKKIQINSAYGFLANQHSRYFDIRLAEAITSNGQVCNRGISKHIKDKLGLDTIAADTDSVSKSTIIEINEVKDTIENMYLSIQGNRVINNDKEYLYPNNSIYSPCYDNDIILTKKIFAIYRHKVFTKKQYRLTTESGKQVCITGDHSIMIKRNSKLIDIQVKDIQPNDKLIVIQ